MTWTSPDITEADRAILRALDEVERLERLGYKYDPEFMREWAAMERKSDGPAKGGQHG